MRSWIVVACVWVGGCKSVEGVVGENAPSIAKTILGDKGTPSTVSALRATLAELDGVLMDAGKDGFKPASAVDKQLGDLARKLDVNFALVARARPLATDAAADIVTFYAGVAEVRGMLDAHVKAAKADDLAIASAERAGAGGLSRYAIVIDAQSPGAESVGAKLVELGPPYCGGSSTPTHTAACPAGESPTAFTYRSDPGAIWTKGDVAVDTVDSVPAKKLVMLVPSGVGDSLVKGANGVASEVLYKRRLRAIADRLGGKNGSTGLIDDGNRLEVALQRLAARP